MSVGTGPCVLLRRIKISLRTLLWHATPRSNQQTIQEPQRHHASKERPRHRSVPSLYPDLGDPNSHATQEPQHRHASKERPRSVPSLYPGGGGEPNTTPSGTSGTSTPTIQTCRDLRTVEVSAPTNTLPKPQSALALISCPDLRTVEVSAPPVTLPEPQSADLENTAA